MRVRNPIWDKFRPTIQLDPFSEDRKSWPRGPWTDEPDKVMWTDEATGLYCLAQRNYGEACSGSADDNPYALGPGTWGVYVSLRPGHPLFGVIYDDARILHAISQCPLDHASLDDGEAISSPGWLGMENPYPVKGWLVGCQLGHHRQTLAPHYWKVDIDNYGRAKAEQVHAHLPYLGLEHARKVGADLARHLARVAAEPTPEGRYFPMTIRTNQALYDVLNWHVCSRGGLPEHNPTCRRVLEGSSQRALKLDQPMINHVHQALASWAIFTKDQPQSVRRAMELGKVLSITEPPALVRLIAPEYALLSAEQEILDLRQAFGIDASPTRELEEIDACSP